MILTVDKRKGNYQLIATFQFLAVVHACSVAISAFNYPFKHLFLLNTTQDEISQKQMNILRINWKKFFSKKKTCVHRDSFCSIKVVKTFGNNWTQSLLMCTLYYTNTFHGLNCYCKSSISKAVTLHSPFCSILSKLQRNTVPRRQITSFNLEILNPIDVCYRYATIKQNHKCSCS